MVAAKTPVEVKSFIAGHARTSGKISHEYREPFRGKLVARVWPASTDDVDHAVSVAVEAKSTVASIPAFERATVLRRSSDLLKQHAPRLARLLTLETGKTIRDSAEEVSRAAGVLSLCADEALRIEGRHIPLDSSAAGLGKIAVGLRFPVGVVAAIVPFNAPINLACHKIGAAFAAGNAVIVKAPPQAPGTCSVLVELLAEAGFPSGSLGLLHGDGIIGQQLVADSRIDFISFTGSEKTGRAIKDQVGLRGCILELGGVGPTIVHADANLDDAASKCVRAGYRLAGQSCASVQNLFLHESVSDAFAELLERRIAALTVGNPFDESVDVGPVINSAASDRICSWVQEARNSGAELLCGGGRDENVLAPVLLAKVDQNLKVVREEVFGPVVALHSYRSLDEVYRWIDRTGLGLNCGIFTSSHAIAIEAVRRVPCGCVIVNGTSTFRPDQFPYGGLRGSGYGREGPHDSVRAMTQERILVLG